MERNKKETIPMRITEETMKQAECPDNSPSPEGGSPVSSPAPQTRRERKIAQRKTFLSMSRQDKLWYIWTYYKIHMAAAVIAVFLAVQIGGIIYNSTFQTVLHGIYLNSRSEASVNLEPLEQDFAAHQGLGKKEVITAETAFIGFGDNATEYSYASMAKITALVSVKDLDFIIGDAEATAHYAGQNAYLDLEQGLPPDLLELVRDRLYYIPDESGTEHAFAVDISNTAFANASHLGQDPPLFAVLSNSRHTELVVALLRYIFAS